MKYIGQGRWLIVAACSLLMLQGCAKESAAPTPVPAAQEKHNQTLKQALKHLAKHSNTAKHSQTQPVPKGGGQAARLMQARAVHDRLTWACFHREGGRGSETQTSDA